MKKYVIPVIVPYAEKKKDWIFDNQKIEKDTQSLTKELLEENIKKHLEKIEEASEQYYVEVAFVGNDFTNISEQQQEEFLELIQKYIKLTVLRIPSSSYIALFNFNTIFPNMQI